MPNKSKAQNLAGIKHTDLAYAVSKLIAAGKTTAAEVARLAAERTSRIKALEAELAGLKGATPTPAEPRGKRRKVASTPALRAARKIQGSYLGYLRQVPDKERAAFKKIAQTKGVPAAVEALKKRLGKK
jgi:anti-sigma factor RsiW